jgi:hypothetical protein
MLMTIAKAREKCKAFVNAVPRDALVVTVLSLTSFASFGLGYLAGQGSPGASRLSIEIAPELEKKTEEAEMNPAEVQAEQGAYVASKNGTKYYVPTCAGAKRIIEQNKIWFTSAAAAQDAGYAPAANCKGL